MGSSDCRTNEQPVSLKFFVGCPLRANSGMSQQDNTLLGGKIIGLLRPACFDPKQAFKLASETYG